MSSNLQQLFAEYLQVCKYTKKLSPITIRGRGMLFRLFLLLMPELGTLETVSQRDIETFLQRLNTREREVGKKGIVTGVKDSTVQTYGRQLNWFFDWAVDGGHIASNPLDGIKLPTPSYNGRKDLTQEEIRKVVSAITLHATDSFIRKRDILILYLFIFCGLRKNELVSLVVGDINIDKKILTVRGETSKSRKTRELPINTQLFWSLDDYIQERKRKRYVTEYLIASIHDKQLTLHGMKHWVKKYEKLSRVKFHVHMFRHTFACNLARQNISAVKIQKLLGHSDLRTTQKYVRSLSVDDVRDAVELLNNCY